ncbi:hypothetical protein HYH02_001583 [Chlamydomonas schloesseri]|uniref:PPPDE domain-containing protein n=1 Tax=Chlamydomonas schloesseri TaxID=2026947 RepID=A0A835WSG1_9CHLO|nr:hypothetical protein HYH02_001583 [Chlamydomonas schloesseri]|eukprot:KAG2453359.1 hypothetical protein HYH02_001583 [Chlamydomonas schloesseri]
MATEAGATPEANAKADDGPKSVLLARRLQVSRYLDPWGAPQITWVHSHQLVRGYKVILNLYDILPPRLNACLSACGLGGAFHSGVEVAGTEYAFGGASAEDQGIMALARPLFVLRREAEETVKAGQDEGGSAAAALEWMPVLRSRVVVGWWLGSLAELDEQVLRPLWLQGKWVGPAYRLLSRNCNHFSRALCGALLGHRSFKAAPGKSDPLRMVPRRVTRLSSLAAALRCCTGRMDSPMPLAPYALNLFQGEPRSITGDLPPWFRVQQQRLAAAAAAAAAADAEEEGSREGGRPGSVSRTRAGAGAAAGVGAGARATVEPALGRRSAAANAAAAAAEARAAATAAARASPTRLGRGGSGPEGGRRTPPFATPGKTAAPADAARRASREHTTTPSAAGILWAPGAGVGLAEAPGFVAEVCSSTAHCRTPASASASASATLSNGGRASPTQAPLAAHLSPLKAPPAGRAVAPPPHPTAPTARSRSGRRVFPDPCAAAAPEAGAAAGDGGVPAAEAAADADVAAVLMSSSRRTSAVEERAGGGAVLPDPVAAAASEGGARALAQHNGQQQQQQQQQPGANATASSRLPPPAPHQPPLLPARAPLPPLHQGANSPVNAHVGAQALTRRSPSPQPPPRRSQRSAQPSPDPDPDPHAGAVDRAERRKAPPPRHPFLPPAPSPSPPPPDGDPARPWSVLSGGFVDLTFDRSTQATPEPPSAVSAPGSSQAPLPLPSAAAAGLNGMQLHRPAAGAANGSGAGGLAAARPATVSGSESSASRRRSGPDVQGGGMRGSAEAGTEAAAGPPAGAAKARSPSPLQQRGRGAGAGVDAAAVKAAGIGGSAAAAECGSNSAMPSSPPSRYEIIAAVDAIGSSRRASCHDE